MKKLVNSAFGNRIYYASVRQYKSGQYLMATSGDRVDLTDDCIAAVFQWFKQELENNDATAHEIRYKSCPGLVLKIEREDS